VHALEIAEHFASLRPLFPAPAIPTASNEILATGESLQAFATGTGRNDFSQQMRNIARHMTPEEIDQVARCYEAEPWSAANLRRGRRGFFLTRN
jgi:cytochrome c553